MILILIIGTTVIGSGLALTFRFIKSNKQIVKAGNDNKIYQSNGSIHINEDKKEHKDFLVRGRKV